MRPHDLIKVSNLKFLTFNTDKDWVTASLRRAPFVVVRRAEPTTDGHIPVGIRGRERNQREAAFLAPEGVSRQITPYEMVEQQMWNSLPADRRQHPVFQTLNLLTEILEDWNWGPTGSVGYEIATGTPAVKSGSDLDLVIASRGTMYYSDIETLFRRLEKLEVRVDIQLETEAGAYVLREILENRGSTVILRTTSGPKLVGSPW